MIRNQQQLIDQLIAQNSETKDYTDNNSEKNVAKKTICTLEALPGPCTTSSIQRWHYHLASGRCRQFTYGGCLGNLNNFPTAMECEKTCSGYIADIPTQPVYNSDSEDKNTKDDSNSCHESPVGGPCRSAS